MDLSRAACLVTLGLVCCAAAFAQGARGAARVFYHDVTVRLDGALPNTNPKLQDDLELYLARSPHGEWRPWVLGYSAFISPRNLRAHDYSRYDWIDDEGTLRSARENGRSITLAVKMTIHPDLWVAGGVLEATLKLTRGEDGSLSGTYEGVFDRSRRSAAGPAGKFEIGGQVTGGIAAKPWPAPVEGHKPLAAGEHPRMLFRKGDLPSLRKRMHTPLGKAILARLERQLDRDDKGQDSWRGYGYGLMYQLTGDEKWARKGRGFCQAVIDGRMQSPRYGWATRDGGYMRIGPSAAAVAATYDVCYGAWEKDFRQWVAGRLLKRIWPNMAISPKRSESDPQYSPRSNHYLLWNGGAGFVALAILGDPGVDEAAAVRAHRIFQRRLKRGLVDGFGDHGWFYEGTFCGRFPTNRVATQYIQALRVAQGKNYVAGCDEAQWLVSKWMYEVVRSRGKPRYYPRGMYARIDQWDHFNGDFALGFGILPETHRPAALWFCRNVLAPDNQWAFDATGIRELVYAYVNWPAGLESKDPAEVLGRTLWDREANFFVFRSGWAGEGDVVVTMHADTKVLGMGLEAKFAVGLPVGPSVRVTHFQSRDDGVTVVAARRREGGDATRDHHFAADFSGLCGSKALLVGLMPARSARSAAEAAKDLTPKQRKELKAILGSLKKRAPKEQPQGADRPADTPGADSRKLTFRGRTAYVMTVQKGPPPEVTVAGEGQEAAILVGPRRITFDGSKLVFGRASD